MKEIKKFIFWAVFFLFITSVTYAGWWFGSRFGFWISNKKVEVAQEIKSQERVNPVPQTTPIKAKEAEKPISKVKSYEVPILMYHYIRIADEDDELGQRLSVQPKVFNEQVKWLKDNNFESMKMADLADPEKKVLSSIIANKKKPVILTFDDGYDNSFTEAKPILEKYGFTGTFFVIENRINKTEYMTNEQIEAMKKSEFEIGSHSISHPNLTIINKTAARKEIFDSKHEATTFCYPAGKYDEETIKTVKEAGYTTAVTTKAGISNQDSDLLALPRVRIENISLENFAKKFKN